VLVVLVVYLVTAFLVQTQFLVLLLLLAVVVVMAVLLEQREVLVVVGQEVMLVALELLDKALLAVLELLILMA
jgi:hypothetical protein